MKTNHLLLALTLTATALLLTASPARTAQLKHTKTATATSNAATLDNTAGIITSETLTTAGLSSYTLTLTNRYVSTTSIVLASVENGTNTQGTVVMGRITPGSGSVVFLVRNLHATEALNGTLKIRYWIVP